MKFICCIIAFNLALSGLFAQNKIDSGLSESELLLKTSTGNISGTLTIPAHVTSSPVVLIIAGSGPTDRDCNSATGLKTDAYKMLAEGLAKNGISALRFDKRGIGKSKLAMTKESELRYETYVKDAEGWISLLKADKRFSKVWVLGHSEGALIGTLAAEKVPVGGLISISGPGKSADLILQQQLKTQLPPSLLMESNRIMGNLKEGKTVNDVNPSLMAMYRPSVQPYMISWIKYDPAKEIKKLKAPTLIIQGNTDLQVTVDDAKLLAAARPDAKLLIIDHMNHVLKESDANVTNNMATYKNPALPLKSGLVDDIVKFIKTQK